MTGRTPVRLGTANFYQRSDNDRAREALFMFAPMCDIFGPLEFGGPKRLKMLVDLCADGLHDFYKPPHIPAGPALVWDTQRFAAKHLDTIMIAAGRDVQASPGKRAHLDDLYGSYGVFADLVDGGEVWGASWHSPAHVEFWPGTGRRAMYREGLTNLLRARLGHPRWAVMGDWNVEISEPRLTTWRYPGRAIHARGGEFMWERHPARKPTEGRRVIDGVASSMLCTQTRVVESNVGDHDFAVGLFDPGHVVGGR